MMHVAYAYNLFVFCHSLQIRSTYLKHRPKVKFLCGVWPMLHIESQKASWKGPEKRKMDQSQTSERQRSSQWASTAAGIDQRLLVWFPRSPSHTVCQVHYWESCQMKESFCLYYRLDERSVVLWFCTLYICIEIVL